MEQDQNYTWQEMPPIKPPKPKKKGGGWLVALLLLLILVMAVLGIREVVRSWNVQLERSANGFSLRVGDVPEQPQSAFQPQSEQPEQRKPEQHASRDADTKLQIEAPKPGAETPSSAAEGALSLQEIYTKMIPSVVSISTDAGTGTGIIMSPDGYIITNNHVISSARKVVVMTHDEQTMSALLVGCDETSDLAVLKVTTDRELTAAEFGDSDALRVGDGVVAIGDPLGTQLRGTMTNGIVSAINRDLMVNDREMTLIQTNAALNNGNSGGPLINCYGQVIGINTIKLSNYYSSATVEGLGFAIPISNAKPIIDELIEKGYVSGRPAIGISGEQLPMAVRAYYGLPDGIYITYVSKNSDSYAKGIREGDILTAINGTAISSVDEMNSIKNEYTAGQTVTVTVYHEGEYYDVNITLMDAALQP